ncbi:MAG: cell wall metabolism sensor histidine kinase WalK, partial [Leptolyngbyaceae cyanobacterium SM1_4_3]|nr:cell wall metabolism sensor histidine kinase WalK [Leptolyngbyaceae cyanobacterium SM1_4_3]
MRLQRNAQFEIDGDRHFLQITPFRDQRGLDWLIVVVLPQSDFTAQIESNTRTTVLLCLAALGVAIAVSVLTSRWITEPIKQMNRASRAIAAGELEQSVQVEGVNELGELADSFNQMAAQLRDSFSALEASNDTLAHTNQELEQRVEQRTTQLQIAKAAADQ